MVKAQDWLRKVFGRTQGSTTRMPPRRRRRTRLQAEQLEPRCVPTVTTLATFNGTNGDTPSDGLVKDSSGNLFGTTYRGGASNRGTVFEVLAGTGTVTTLATFNGTNGGSPNGVIEDSSGNLFGTTSGGASGYGTVFEVQQGSSTVTTLATFNFAIGGSPFAGLVEDSSGNLFGTTYLGGASNDGTVFEVLAGSATITTLATFNGTNGEDPLSGLIEDSSGNLFGTTSAFGASYGTVFEVQAGSGTVTTLATFNGTNGVASYGSLTEDSSGNLFGTTTQGGAASEGTVFEMQQGSGTITTLATFNGTNGAYPRCGLVKDSSSNLFGTTPGGGASGNGTVFELQQGSNSITTLAFFKGTNGASPTAELVEDGSGNLFGATSFGGPSDRGTVFEVLPSMIITTGSLANWTINQPGYSQTIGTSGGTGMIAFSKTAGTLPTGLTLSSTGVLSGTPTVMGTYNFTVTATDSVGASASHSYSIAISTGAFSQYVVTLQGSSTVPAGNAFLVTVQAADAYGNPVTNYTGPASVTATLSPTITASNLPTTVAINSNGLCYFLASVQKAGTYTISVADPANTFTGSAPPVTVTAGPAAKLAFVVQPASTPTGVNLPPAVVQLLDLYGNVVTSDNSDAVVLSIASGPGSFAAGSTTTAPVLNGVATFNNLTLVTPGTYTLGALVSMLYAGPNSAPFTVAPLQVAPGSFAATPSGFSLQFNAPFLVNSTTPVLFGQGFGATAPSPSVIVTTDPGNLGDTAAIVEGSLVLNTATNSLTFVATNTVTETNNSTPILADGTYTVIVRSSTGTDGFQALNGGGGFLDGKSIGIPGSGDFTTTFTVGAAAAHDDVVWVPATADGPGQALSAPGQNQAGSGYPVYLSDSTGSVTSAQLTLNYNPALLTVTGANGTGFSLLGTSTPGHAVLQYSGAALAMGSQTPMGFLTASVPGGTVTTPTPYKAKDLLHLTGVSLNGGAVNVVTGDGLHLVSYVADADGNGSYSSNDAVLITRVALQTDTGFTAYPLVDPVIVADTDGAGFVPADAPLQANEAGVGFPTANLTIPPVPAGVHFQAIANNVDPALSIPIDLHVGANGTLAVPVNIDDAHPEGSTGLTEAHLALQYDPRLFAVSAADIHLGSVLAAGSGWSVTPTIDPITGQIAIALSSTTPILSTQGGSLVTIDFHQQAIVGRIGNPSYGGAATFALVASASPNGQYVTTELEDAQGTFTLTPAPSNGFDARIDGVVTLPVPPAVTHTSSAPGENAERSDVAPVEVAHFEGRPTATPPVDNPTQTAVGSESSERVTGETATVRGGAAALPGAMALGGGFLVSTSVGAEAPGPVAVLVFPFVTPYSAGVAEGQRLADHGFGSLVPGTSLSSDQAMPTAVADAYNRDGVRPVLRSLFTSDHLEGARWDDVNSELDGQGGSDSTLLGRRRGPRNGTIHQDRSPPLQRAVVDRAALDQVFAQSADEMDLDTVDDN